MQVGPRLAAITAGLGVGCLLDFDPDNDGVRWWSDCDENDSQRGDADSCGPPTASLPRWTQQYEGNRRIGERCTIATTFPQSMEPTCEIAKCAAPPKYFTDEQKAIWPTEQCCVCTFSDNLAAQSGVIQLNHDSTSYVLELPEGRFQPRIQFFNKTGEVRNLSVIGVAPIDDIACGGSDQEELKEDRDGISVWGDRTITDAALVNFTGPSNIHLHRVFVARSPSTHGVVCCSDADRAGALVLSDIHGLYLSEVCITESAGCGVTTGGITLEDARIPAKLSNVRIHDTCGQQAAAIVARGSTIVADGLSIKGSSSVEIPTSVLIETREEGEPAGIEATAMYVEPKDSSVATCNPFNEPIPASLADLWLRGFYGSPASLKLTASEIGTLLVSEVGGPEVDSGVESRECTICLDLESQSTLNGLICAQEADNEDEYWCGAELEDAEECEAALGGTCECGTGTQR